MACTNLVKINIPESVKFIGNNAFGDCENLSEITIPDSVSSIGITAFDNCKKLTIYGSSGSCAEKYANENGIKFYTL